MTVTNNKKIDCQFVENKLYKLLLNNKLSIRTNIYVKITVNKSNIL